MSARRRKWWRVPPNPSTREGRAAIWQRFNQARRAMKQAMGAADDNGWCRSEGWYEARQAEVARAGKKYADARAAWVAAGSPTPDGKQQAPRRGGAPGGPGDGGEDTNDDGKGET